ncbi:MAG: phosphate ABC transporter substrate-binding protein [Clostridiales bacterium]|nr:phosphate ABC transporter substrate-binding protein [Clostridiales bacterium]
MVFAIQYSNKKQTSGRAIVSGRVLAKGKCLACLIASFLLLAILSGCGGGSHSTVIVAGSTSVQPYAEILAEEFSLRHPGHEVDIQGGGSSAGITAAIAGTADIGMSSRHLNEKEQDLWSVEIAKDGLAIILHPSNPVSDLTLSQIRDIYMGAILNWKEVGGPDARIHLISREEGSGTRSAFEELVMNKALITPKAIIQDSNGAVWQLVSGDPYSVGFISMGLVDHSVKALKLGGVPCTMENVLDGTYGLSRPFLYVCGETPSGLVKDFIDYTLSQEGQGLLVSEGLIPGMHAAQ